MKRKQFSGEGRHVVLGDTFAWADIGAYLADIAMTLIC